MKDFHTMTADEISSYTGPVYRATIVAVRKGGGRDAKACPHDINSTSMTGLHAIAADLAKNWHIVSFTYGPHTADQGRVRIEDDNPTLAMGL